MIPAARQPTPRLRLASPKRGRGPWRLVLLWGLGPTLVAAGLSLYRPAFVTGLEHIVYDTMVRSAPTRPPSGQIVIVDIDERSLSAIGQWPWRRDVMGDLITRLRDLGASIIALDIIFAEPDRQEAFGVGTDTALVEALRPGRVVLGYALTFDDAPEKPGTCLQHPLGLPIIRRDDESTDVPFFHATAAICNLPALTQAAHASGFLNAAPDPDGILRRVPLLMEFNGRVYPSLAAAAITAATAVRNPALHIANVNTSWLVLDTRNIPIDGKSNLLLRYRGPKRTFPYVSAVDVLNSRVSPATFTNKLVFVGTTALGTREVVATPLDTLFAGVEVQATVADNLLQQDFIRRPEHGVALETQAVLGVGALAALVVGVFGLGWGAVAMVACLAALWMGTISLLSTDGTFFSPLFPTAGLFGALAGMTVAQFTVERRRADRAGREKAVSQRLMVRTLLSLTEVRDADTGRHSRRTENYTRALAAQLATNPQFAHFLTPERIDLFASLAPLHDIGKVGVPDRVLNKPGSLTAEELAEMRKHPDYGREVIVRAQQDAGAVDDEILAMAKDIVYTHHEKWDGTGYPQALRGAEIPIVGRVMAVVDVYDAITTRRAYQVAMSHDEAVAFIAAARGAHFDPDVVSAFIKVSDDLRRISADGDR